MDPESDLEDNWIPGWFAGPVIVGFLVWAAYKMGTYRDSARDADRIATERAEALKAKMKAEGTWPDDKQS